MGELCGSSKKWLRRLQLKISTGGELVEEGST